MIFFESEAAREKSAKNVFKNKKNIIFAAEFFLQKNEIKSVFGISLKIINSLSNNKQK